MSRRYRRIRSDIQPIIEQLEAGETPGDQIQGRGYKVYKVRVRNSAAKRGKSGLLYLLESGIPVKVRAELDDVCSRDDRGTPTVSLGWTARIASVALALGHVYVMQSAISHPSYVQQSMMAGFNYDGPALFSLYTGNTDHQAGLPPYLVAAAAAESRAFP